jgi:4-hydroxy-2-oxoheptanedioate aldolase
MKTRRSMHERLAYGRALIGLQQTHPNPALAEMAGLCGYDFVMLDAEHGVFSEQDYLQSLQALAAGDVLGWVRLADGDTRAVGRFLDMGVDAIVAPNVSTAEQAQSLVRAMSYPPRGTRGFGAPAHRAIRYGMDLAEHLKAPRGNTYLLVLIESAQGIEIGDAILGVDGVDGALIGPSDLSASLGDLRNYAQPAYAKAMASVERATLAAGKVLGTAPHAGNSLEALLARGHRMFILDADMSLIREAMASQVAKAKATIEKSGAGESQEGGSA